MKEGAAQSECAAETCWPFGAGSAQEATTILMRSEARSFILWMNHDGNFILWMSRAIARSLSYSWSEAGMSSVCLG